MSTAGNPLRVKDFICDDGALVQGDGSHDDTTGIQRCFDAAFGPATAPHGYNNYISNWAVFFPPGVYRTTGEVVLNAVHGGLICGAGKGHSIIRNDTSGTNVIRTNGFAYSTIRDLGVVSAGGAGSSCFYWNGVNAPLNVNCQRISFVNMEFNGGEKGVSGGLDDIGGVHMGVMASEALFLNCTIKNCLWGLRPEQLNALNWTVIGGNVENCGSLTYDPNPLNTGGLWAAKGSIPFVRGVRFSGNSSDYFNATGTPSQIVACYSDSVNFYGAAVWGGVIIKGCTHVGAAGGSFARFHAGEGSVIIDACYSTNGIISSWGGSTGAVYLRGSKFDNPSYIDAAALPAHVYIDDVFVR